MSAHATHHMHGNSLGAYGTQRVELSQRHAKILALIDSHAEPLTDREIMLGCGFTDMNAVRPGITNLTKAGVLAEVGSIKDDITGRTVRLSQRARKP